METRFKSAFILSLAILLVGASSCGGESVASKIESESANREKNSEVSPEEEHSSSAFQTPQYPRVDPTKDQNQGSGPRTSAPIIHAKKDEEHTSVVKTHATKEEEHVSVVRTPAPVVHATKDEEHTSVVKTHATKEEEHVSVVRTPAPVVHATKDEEHTTVVRTHATKEEEHFTVVVDRKHPDKGKGPLLSFENRDWGTVTAKKRSEKGAYGVIVLSADDGSSLAVKDHPSIYSSFIANELLKSAQFSIAENLLVKKDKPEGRQIQGAIEGTQDQSKTKKARTTPSVSHFQVQEWISGGHITDQKNLRKLSKQDAEEIGRIYIYDQLLQYRDRIWIGKNLRANPTNTGNMLYDQNKKRITFIDNGIGMPNITDAKKKEKYIEDGIRSIHELVGSVNDPKFASTILSQLKSESGETVDVRSEDIQIGLKNGIEELRHLGSGGVRDILEKAIRTLEGTDVTSEDLERVIRQKEILSELMVAFK